MSVLDLFWNQTQLDTWKNSSHRQWGGHWATQKCSHHLLLSSSLCIQFTQTMWDEIFIPPKVRHVPQDWVIFFVIPSDVALKHYRNERGTSTNLLCSRAGACQGLPGDPSAGGRVHSTQTGNLLNNPQIKIPFCSRKEEKPDIPCCLIFILFPSAFAINKSAVIHHPWFMNQDTPQNTD